MSAYYNEFDPKAAAVIRQLIKEGHIADGDVDERSIEDVAPNELLAYTQVHLFAGYGIWSLAFRWAGIADTESAWSCSCPCQPFSAAGQGKGFADERHLWPAAFHLIQHARRRGVPLYGEQVASSRVMPWIDLVWSDLEATGDTFRAVILASAGFGAPIIRQRTFWVASAGGERRDRFGLRVQSGESRQANFEIGRNGEAIGVASTASLGRERRRAGEEIPAPGTIKRLERLCDARRLGSPNLPGQQGRKEPGECSDQCSPRESGVVGRLAGTDGGESSDGDIQRCGRHGLFTEDSGVDDGDRRPGPTNGHWRDADWLRCRDALWRPVETSAQPLVDGDTESLGRVCDQSVTELEEEINGWSRKYKGNATQGLLCLQQAYVSVAKQRWPIGGFPSISSASVLLSFLRQLTHQGWSFAECILRPSEKTPEGFVRGLRGEEAAPCSSCGRGLDEFGSAECPDALHVLSSILARHAQTSWVDTHAAHAEIGFPLGKDSIARVGRLRGYGNAISPQVAAEFIKAHREAEGIV